MSGNYDDLLMRAFEAGAFKMSQLNDVRVGHDNWCGSHMSMRCNCKPDLYVIDENGDKKCLAKNGVLQPFNAPTPNGSPPTNESN